MSSTIDPNTAPADPYAGDPATDPSATDAFHDAVPEDTPPPPPADTPPPDPPGPGLDGWNLAADALLLTATGGLVPLAAHGLEAAGVDLHAWDQRGEILADLTEGALAGGPLGEWVTAPIVEAAGDAAGVETDVTPEHENAAQVVGHIVRDTALSFTPVGWLVDGADVVYGGAQILDGLIRGDGDTVREGGINVLAGGLGFIPLIGDAAKVALKGGAEATQAAARHGDEAADVALDAANGLDPAAPAPRSSPPAPDAPLSVRQAYNLDETRRALAENGEAFELTADLGNKGVWGWTDPDSGRTIYVKWGPSSEAARTQAAWDATLSPDSVTYRAGLVTQNLDDLPPHIRQHALANLPEGYADRSSLVVVEGVEAGPGLFHVQGEPPPRGWLTPADSRAALGGDRAAENARQFVQDWFDLNRQGIHHNDLLSNVQIARDANGEVVFQVFDFEELSPSRGGLSPQFSDLTHLETWVEGLQRNGVLTPEEAASITPIFDRAYDLIESGS